MARKTAKKAASKKRKVSRVRKPEDLSLEAWQVVLRRQFAAEQAFRLKNVGAEPIFSEFEVKNPQTKRTYRVAIRGESLGVNYCSCPDFTVNTLGTCKHIESTLAKLRRRRGAKAAFAKGFEPTYSEVFLRYGAKRDVIFRPGTTCPDSLRRSARRFFTPDGVLRENAYSRFHTFLAKATAEEHDGHEVRCYDDALEFASQIRDRAELARRIDAAFPDGAEDKKLESLLKARLYTYQCQGALFAAKAGRCLIADDMGLGKTIQAIAAAEILARHADIRRVLIICPTSLKHQWKQEIEKFSAHTACVIEGSIKTRQKLYATEAFYQIVNYDVVHRDLDAIEEARYDLLILDEAQRIKNWKTRTAKSVKQLDSDYAFVLTGTPLENRLEELHSIVEFLDRHRLGPMFRFLATHQHLDETGRVVGYRELNDISRTLAPILVRRTKEAVLTELPERLEKRFFVPMTDQQMAHHEENREIVAKIVHKWRRRGYLSEIDQRRLTCALQNMRMSCDSTYLLDKQTDHGCKADELAALLDDILVDPGAKVVVFSQWLRMHELIVRRLERRKLGHVLFHGGVPSAKRKGLVSRFREDPDCRLFLSTDAGGVGLNLQHASVVVNMDMPWNPAVLEQRVGRVHRLGQRQPVRVVHFVAQGTIEEGMLGLLSFKKSMFTGVLDGGKNEVFLGGTRLKKFMDSVETATTTTASPIQAPDAEGRDAPGAGEGGGSTSAQVNSVATPGPTAPDPSEGSLGVQGDTLGNLLTAGAAFLNELGQSLRQANADTPGSASPTASRLIERDETTGQTYLRLPLPRGDAVQSLTGLLQSVVSSLQQKPRS